MRCWTQSLPSPVSLRATPSLTRQAGDPNKLAEANAALAEGDALA